MLEILYQDQALVVCVKPFRVLSTDEPGGMPDLIRQAIGQPQAKVRTVHRLDQVVGGLMVYGLTGHAASELSRQIREDQFQKEYQAVVHWRPQYDAGTYIDLLGRNEKTRKTYVAKVPGKGIQQAVLHYRLLDNRQGFSLVEIRLETGRTHQIRAQFSARGMPLAGDRKYSKYPDPPSGLYPSGNRGGHGLSSFPAGDGALDALSKYTIKNDTPHGLPQFSKEPRQAVRHVWWGRGSKNHLNQDHIKNGSSGNAQENIFLPPVQQSDDQNAQKLRQAMPAGEDRVFQTKDHQQADDCAGKHCAQVTDKRRGLFAFREEKEGEKAGGHGTQHHGRHSENLL